MAYRKSKYDNALQREFYKTIRLIKKNPGNPDLFKKEETAEVIEKNFMGDFSQALLRAADSLHRDARIDYEPTTDYSFTVSVKLPSSIEILSSSKHNVAILQQNDSSFSAPINYEALRGLKGIGRILSMAKTADVAVDLGLAPSYAGSIDLCDVFDRADKSGYRAYGRLIIEIHPHKSFDATKYPKKMRAEKPVKRAALKK